MMKQLNEVARMQQLAGITEIKIDKPVNKRQLLQSFLEGGHFWLLYQLSESSNIEEFLAEEGYNSLEEYFDDEDTENIPEMINLINFYFRYFKKDEIYVVITGSEGENEFNLPQIYKKMITTGNGIHNYIILHNL